MPASRARVADAPIAPAYVSIGQGIVYSGLSRATLYRAIESGALPSFKVTAGRRLIRISDLDRFITGGDAA